MGTLKHTPVPLAIIGGGAAGMFAAACAANRGLGCLVFERKARLGSKVLMTANGRCNFTKDIPPAEMLADIGEPVASFVRPALMRCPPRTILDGFRSLGLKTKRMTDGRIFPASEKAADVAHAFGDLLRDRDVPLAVNCPVTGLQAMKNGFIVATRHFTVWAENVLVTTGGVSFPKTGSTGDGQGFARQLGHRIEPYRPGLTGFDLPRPPRPVRYEDAVARVFVEGAMAYMWRGEVEFERKGVTGAAVYNCQRWVARHAPRDFELVLECGGERMALRNPVPRPLKESIVTVGGVSREDVDPETMASRVVPGLYFAGEVLDIDGPTGGYNLTLAFATARLAVESIWSKTRRTK